MKYQRAWIIYSWIAIFLLVFDTFQKIRGAPSITPGPYYINGLRAIAILALIGFAYQKKIASRLFWQGFFAVHSYFVFKLFNTFSRIDTGDISFLALLLLLFTYLPVYYANFGYAFMSKKVWEKQE
jgi:hypothetical protein